VKNKAVERDIGKIDIGMALAVAVGMAVTGISVTLAKGGVDFVAAGEARCGCSAREICGVLYVM
jgi:hypothetical protein